MIDYHHTKFGLIRIKESKVTKGGRADSAPQVENVLNRPGEIGLRKTHRIRRNASFLLAIFGKPTPGNYCNDY